MKETYTPIFEITGSPAKFEVRVYVMDKAFGKIQVRFFKLEDFVLSISEFEHIGASFEHKIIIPKEPVNSFTIKINKKGFEPIEHKHTFKN